MWLFDPLLSGGAALQSSTPVSIAGGTSGVAGTTAAVTVVTPLAVTGSTAGTARMKRKTLRDNLVAWWAMEESTGNRTDLHAGLVLSETQGGPSPEPILSAPSKVADGVDFVFADSMILRRIDDANLSANGKSFHVAFWLKLKDRNFDFGLVSKGGIFSQAGWGLCLGLSSQWLIFDMFDPDNPANYKRVQGPPTSGNITANTWYFVEIEFDHAARMMHGRIDGQPIDLNPHADWPYNDPDDSGRAFTVGYGNGQNGFVNGLMDEVAYWHKTISAAQSTYIYNGGNGVPYRIIDSLATDVTVGRTAGVASARAEVTAVAVAAASTSGTAGTQAEATSESAADPLAIEASTAGLAGTSATVDSIGTAVASTPGVSSAEATVDAIALAAPSTAGHTGTSASIIDVGSVAPRTFGSANAQVESEGKAVVVASTPGLAGTREEAVAIAQIAASTPGVASTALDADLGLPAAGSTAGHAGSRAALVAVAIVVPRTAGVARSASLLNAIGETHASTAGRAQALSFVVDVAPVAASVAGLAETSSYADSVALVAGRTSGIANALGSVIAVAVTIGSTDGVTGTAALLTALVEPTSIQLSGRAVGLASVRALADAVCHTVCKAPCLAGTSVVIICRAQVAASTSGSTFTRSSSHAVVTVTCGTNALSSAKASTLGVCRMAPMTRCVAGTGASLVVQVVVEAIPLFRPYRPADFDRNPRNEGVATKLNPRLPDRTSEPELTRVPGRLPDRLGPTRLPEKRVW